MPNANQLRQTITDKLRAAARANDRTVDVERSRYFRHHLIVRLSESNPNQWIVTGATALETRFELPRGTSDLDTITLLAGDEVAQSITDLGNDPGDPFEYTVTSTSPMKALAGGSLKVDISLEGKSVARFSMDIALADTPSNVSPDTLRLTPSVDISSEIDSTGDVLVGAVAKFGRQEDLREIITAMGIFSGRHFPREIILWAVRWYCRYGLSYRDLEEMMTSAGRAGRSHHDLPLGPEIRP